MRRTSWTPSRQFLNRVRQFDSARGLDQQTLEIWSVASPDTNAQSSGVVDTSE